jgi:predicted nucleic acid-binding protein
MLGRDVAIKSAENYRKLRARGITIRKTIDCLIATCCLENNFALLHSDRDFEPFEKHLGLQVRHP